MAIYVVFMYHSSAYKCGIVYILLVVIYKIYLYMIINCFAFIIQVNRERAGAARERRDLGKKKS